MNIQQFLNQRRMDYTPQTGEHSKKFQPVPCAAMCRIGYSVESTPQTKPDRTDEYIPRIGIRHLSSVDDTKQDKPVETYTPLTNPTLDVVSRIDEEIYTPRELGTAVSHEECNLPTYQEIIKEWYK